MKKVNIREGFDYQKLTPEEMKARGILGRLVGPCSDFNKGTRNGRKYSEQLWENVFNSDIMKEKILNKVCFGELGHPEDRTEIDPEKVAICLTEQPTKGSDGKLWAVFDILDTPNGRILKAFCDYGSTVGVSSRGQGDIITDDDGNEAVDPDTYECECWDVVLIPAVKEARMKFVTEGLEKKITLKQALTEAYDKENEEGKKVMDETLKNLNINLSEDVDTKELAKDQKEVKKETEKAINALTKEAEEIQDKIDDLKAGMELETAPVADEVTSLETPVEETPVEDETSSVEPIEEPVTEEPIGEEPVAEPVEEPIGEEEISESLTEEVEDKEIKEINKDQKEVAKETAKAISELEDEKAEVEEKISKLEAGMEIPAEATEEPVAEEPVTESLEATPETVDTTKDICTKLFELLDSITTEENKEVISSKVNEIIEAHAELEDEDWAELGVTIEDEDEISPNEEKDDAKLIVSDDTDAQMTSEEEIPLDIEDKGSETTVDESLEAVDSGSAELIKSLTEALKTKSELESNFKSLQEKLAVRDSEVENLNEECKKLKEAVARLATIAKSKKDLEEEAVKLKESLDSKDEIIADQKTRISRLVSERKEELEKTTTLNESVTSKTTELTKLSESLAIAEEAQKTLTEQLSTVKAEHEQEVKTLHESLNKTKRIAESYKGLATKAVNRYIDTKANLLGVTSSDIKRKLGESYTMEDVDQVCEDLKSYQLNVMKLPFSLDRKVGVRVNESRSTAPINRTNTAFDDDEVDDSLFRLANL